MLLAGDVVGDYRVIEPAGAGGMGAVYKVEHLITRRIEAMKVLPLSLGRDPDDIRRFEREIQAQARLQHPNIASLYSAVKRDDAIALLMEWVEGEPLARTLERAPLAIGAATAIAGQVLEALAYAHRRGVIHCDVSPANIILLRDGAAKLTDFGLSRAAGDLGMSNGGVAMGSPWHMPPEQVRGTAPVDARADLYAAGTVLYEMLTGRKLFDVEGTFAVLRAQLDTVPPPPSSRRDGIPPALDAVVMKSVAKDPAARFQSADEFRLAIQGALLGRAPARPQRTALRPMLVAAGLGMVACAAVLLPMRPRGVAPAPAAVSAPPSVVPAASTPTEEAPSQAAEPEPDPAVEVAEVKRPPRRQPARPLLAPIGPKPTALVPERSPALLEPERIEPLPALAPPVLHAPVLAPPQEPAPEPGEAKREKSGNRFVRAIGKLNPFRKRQ